MIRVAAILAVSLAALPGSAQHQVDLATTRDGSVLYFSYVPPTGFQTKVYRWSSVAGLTLFGDRPGLAQTPPLYGEHLYGTQTTYDGTVLFHAESLCSTGMGPGFNNCTVGETEAVIPDSKPFRIPGFLLISPNGRYGVFAPFNNGGLWVDWLTGEQIEVDFHNQIVPNVTPPFSVNQHAVANNGTFLITAPGGNGLRIWTKDGESMLPATNLIRNASISADGSTVAVSAAEIGFPDYTIPTYVYDLTSGRRTKFIQVVSLSEDGQTVAYLSADIVPFINAQAMVARADGTRTRQITNVPEGVQQVLLSGDARYIYVVIGNPYLYPQSRIQRYELATGAVQDIPPVP